MVPMTNATAAAVTILVVELIPAVAFGFASERLSAMVGRWPRRLRIAIPAVLVLPYAFLALSQRIFRWEWFALYLSLPVAMAWLLDQASQADPEQRGNWRDALILLTL